jgi:hypothetical protein
MSVPSSLEGEGMEFLVWLENTPVSAFMREDFYAYFVLLIFHALGMAFFVGGGLVICLRVLGVAKEARLEHFGGFLPYIRMGIVLAVISGIGLLLGYPAKALTNWIFYAKLLCLAGAGVMLWRIMRDLFPIAARDEPLPANAKPMALITLALFALGVIGGKLLLYTNIMLMASHE